MVAGAAAGAGVGIYVLWRLGQLQRVLAFVALLFTRLDATAAGVHFTRAEILKQLDAGTSYTAGELAYRIGANKATLVYHLRLLARLGRVRTLRVGRVRVWYRAGTPPPPPARTIVSRASGGAELLAALAERPGLSLSELARSAGVPKATAHRHLARLAAAGEVELRRERGRLRCYPASAA